MTTAALVCLASFLLGLAAGILVGVIDAKEGV